MDSSVLLTARDLTTQYRISRDRAYELMHSKSFPSFKWKGRFYVSQPDMELWVRSQRGKEFHVRKKI